MLKQQLIDSIQQIEDEEALAQFAKSLKKLETEGKNDLADLKTLKAERKELRAEKDKIYNILSFHLGSPLRTLQALSEMLLGDSERLDKQGVLEFNKHLNSQIEKLQDLMGNLIDWSSLEVRNFQQKETEFDLSELVEKVLAKHQSQFEKKQISLEIELEKDLKVNGDQEMIRKSIENLLTNSLKFTLKEGNATVSTKKENGKAVFSLTDSGIGMSGAKIANIFNPSRKATQKGTANELGLGMGLIVTKAYLQLHDSELTIESEQGKGTMVSFELLIV
ncbi:MAG: signal transduction histidine kinase [Arenicella sp.]|jgi:signal transduction histidine kinase